MLKFKKATQKKNSSKGARVGVVFDMAQVVSGLLQLLDNKKGEKGIAKLNRKLDPSGAFHTPPLQIAQKTQIMPFPFRFL